MICYGVIDIDMSLYLCMGLTYNVHVKRGGGLKSKYSCTVHSDFYCFASADICRHGLLHVATRVAYTNIRWSMRSDEVWMHHYFMSFQYKWRLMVRSYFHRCTSADIFRHRSMSPFIAEWCHSDKTWHRWASVGIHRRPMHSDEVWTHHYGAFRLPSFCNGRRLSTLVFCGTTRVMRTNIHNAHCCERLASADVDRCTVMKSECTIMVRSDFIVVHHKFRLSIVKPSYLGLA